MRGCRPGLAANSPASFCSAHTRGHDSVDIRTCVPCRFAECWYEDCKRTREASVHTIVDNVPQCLPYLCPPMRPKTSTPPAAPRSTRATVHPVHPSHIPLPAQSGDTRRKRMGGGVHNEILSKDGIILMVRIRPLSSVRWHVQHGSFSLNGTCSTSG
jgi:hypothetical protein